MQKIVKNFKGELIMATEKRQFNRRKSDIESQSFITELKEQFGTIVYKLDTVIEKVSCLDKNINGNGQPGLKDKVGNNRTSIKMLMWLFSGSLGLSLSANLAMFLLLIKKGIV